MQVKIPPESHRKIDTSIASDVEQKRNRGNWLTYLRTSISESPPPRIRRSFGLRTATRRRSRALPAALRVAFRKRRSQPGNRWLDMGSFGVRPSNVSLAQLGQRFVGLNTIGPARSLTRGAFFGWRLSLCQPTESSAHRRRHGSSKIKFVCSKKIKNKICIIEL